MVLLNLTIDLSLLLHQKVISSQTVFNSFTTSTLSILHLSLFFKFFSVYLCIYFILPLQLVNFLREQDARIVEDIYIIINIDP